MYCACDMIQLKRDIIMREIPNTYIKLHTVDLSELENCMKIDFIGARVHITVTSGASCSGVRNSQSSRVLV